jgi:hypothetical protein
MHPSTPPHLSERRKVRKSTRDVLRLNVHHGDIIIQQGAGLQKLYEVIPLEMIVDSSMLRYPRE